MGAGGKKHKDRSTSSPAALVAILQSQRTDRHTTHYLSHTNPWILSTSDGRNTIGIQYIFQYFGFFGYFVEYNTAWSIPILVLLEYRIPYDIGIREEIGIPDENRYSRWNQARDAFMREFIGGLWVCLHTYNALVCTKICINLRSNDRSNRNTAMLVHATLAKTTHCQNWRTIRRKTTSCLFETSNMYSQRRKSGRLMRISNEAESGPGYELNATFLRASVRFRYDGWCNGVSLVTVGRRPQRSPALLDGLRISWNDLLNLSTSISPRKQKREPCHGNCVTINLAHPRQLLQSTDFHKTCLSWNVCKLRMISVDLWRRPFSINGFLAPRNAEHTRTSIFISPATGFARESVIGSR
jgi:hypothetical protein